MRALGWDVEEELGPDITAPVVLESLEEAWREVRGGKSDDEDEGKDDMDLGEAAVSWRGAPMVARPAARPRLDEALALSLLKAMYNAARDSMGVGKRQLVAAFKDERRRARPDYAAAAASSGAEITLGDDEVDNDNADPYTFDLTAYATCVAAVACARDAAAGGFGRKLGEETLAAVSNRALGRPRPRPRTLAALRDLLASPRGLRVRDAADAAPGEKGVLIKVRVPATLAACSAADLVASGAVPDLHRRACTALLERRGGRVVACATTRTGDASSALSSRPGRGVVVDGRIVTTKHAITLQTRRARPEPRVHKPPSSPSSTSSARDDSRTSSFTELAGWERRSAPTRRSRPGRARRARQPGRGRCSATMSASFA